jgi:DnaJ-class molecular chaperone
MRIRFDSIAVAMTNISRSRLSTPMPGAKKSPRSGDERKRRKIIWVDCPSCYGFGTTKMEWGEWFQTCPDCNGNGLLEAEPKEEE